MIVRNFFIFSLSQSFFYSCQSISGVIWDKQNNTFREIFSIPIFANLHKQRIELSRQNELHNFNGIVLKASYYQERRMVVFNDDGTKVEGIFPDIWSLVADYLNFTLVSVKFDRSYFGERLKNGTYTGLLSLLHSNEIQIIYRTGFYIFRMGHMDYTTPMWKSRYRFYIRPEWKYDNTWIVTLFSKETWYSIIALIIILSLTGYLLQKPQKRIKKKEKNENFNLSDHFFYTFAIVCSQGYVPDNFHNKFRILSLSKSVFAWLILIAFSSHLIYRMTNRVVTPPFVDINSLINKTNYKITAFKGSMIYESLQRKFAHPRAKKFISGRIEYEQTSDAMQNKCCYSNKQYAMLDIDDKQQARPKVACRLIPVGKGMYETWITSGITKGMKYKRSIDVSILKLHEVGLIDALRDRWFDLKVKDIEILYKPIDFEQVYMVFMLICIGITLSLLVLVIEHIIFFSEQRGCRIC